MLHPSTLVTALATHVSFLCGFASPPLLLYPMPFALQPQSWNWYPGLALARDSSEKLSFVSFGLSGASHTRAGFCNSEMQDLILATEPQESQTILRNTCGTD